MSACWCQVCVCVREMRGRARVRASGRSERVWVGEEGGDEGGVRRRKRRGREGRRKGERDEIREKRGKDETREKREARIDKR